MWIVLGLGAVVTAVVNIIMMMSNRETKYFRFASVSLTALTVCAFYGDEAQRVIQEDWSGLMDVMPSMSRVLWICVIASIVINGISLFMRK